MKTMNIAVVTYDYPDSHRPVYPFVKEVVDEWGKLGHQVMVISPFSITRARSLSRFKELDHSDTINIIRPKIVSLSYHLKYKGRSLTDRIHEHAIYNALRRLAQRPDVIYCHFWKEAMFAYAFAEQNDIPLVVASGESDIPTFLKSEPYLSMCNKVKKVICVSSKNMNESVGFGLTTKDRCIVLPNAIDNSLFKVTNQSELKKKLGITDKDFVVAFVGWFNERKGSKRVSEALKRIANANIKALFIGSGTEDPDYQDILFKGAVPHEDIPNYLNCADVFVLPTLKEGCCNAIVEAMACGLPVISSNRDFNWDILDETNSIMVDPTSVDEIAAAILKVYSDITTQQKMRESTLRKAENLTIGNRAKRIIEFINS